MPPIYLYECSICGKTLEEMRCIASRDSLPYCYCNVDHRGVANAMQRVVTPVKGIVKNPAVPRKGR